ncbi:MAG: hypothetical protein E6K91_01135 [Thaumarchaeota archaeon]|nr:MAG: hypothetical protein E6K91_01135 [Nitrososphaerota archaeon]
MFKKTYKRKAISTVLTTMIIVVASVVLATGVVLFGTSTFQNKAQGESLATTGTQVWADSANSGWAWGAFDVRNIGDKMVSIDVIELRGQAMPYGNWYYDHNQTEVTITNFQQKLNYTGIIVGGSLDGMMKNYTGAAPACATPATLCVNLIGTSATNQVLHLKQASGPISLSPGERAIVYFQVTKNLLSAIDASTTSSVAVYAHNVGSPVVVTVQNK